MRSISLLWSVLSIERDFIVNKSVLTSSTRNKKIHRTNMNQDGSIVDLSIAVFFYVMTSPALPFEKTNVSYCCREQRLELEQAVLEVGLGQQYHRRQSVHRDRCCLAYHHWIIHLNHRQITSKKHQNSKQNRFWNSSNACKDWTAGRYHQPISWWRYVFYIDRRRLPCQATTVEENSVVLRRSIVSLIQLISLGD